MHWSKNKSLFFNSRGSNQCFDIIFIMFIVPATERVRKKVRNLLLSRRIFETLRHPRNISTLHDYIDTRKFDKICFKKRPT